MPDPETYPIKPRSTRKKWYAIIIVLILILSSLGILSLLHPSRLEPEISVDVAPNYITVGQNYTLALKADESYKDITIEWGDNNQTTLNYTGTFLSISHVYSSLGIYYISYWANFSSGIYKSNTYIPVYVESSQISNRTASGIITVLNSSKPSVVSNSNIYSPGTVLNITLGNSSCPANSTFTIKKQELFEYKNGTIPPIPSLNSTFKLQLSLGYYILKLSTITGNGTKNYTTYYYMDIPVNPHARLYITTVSDSIVVDSLTPFTNLNPQEACTEGNLQILYNTEEFLIGNSTSGYFPEIASSLPMQDGKSYTFNISHNVRFQNGIPVNAYDVYYSLVMDLLLENKSPQTPGWILAQYLLPGNYHDTNNYTNIKNAISYSNQTDTVTLNFTVKLNPDTVYSILSSPGTFIASAANLSQNGETISFNQTGFQLFKTDNLNYTMENILADGPYEIEKSAPGSYIMLVRNPDFKGNLHNPEPKIDSIIIEYKNSYSSMYQDMRFNTSQIATFPSSYTYISSIHGISDNITYNMSTIYNFNSNINETLLGKYVTDKNIPSNLFSNITVRKVFYNAYPGHNLTLARSLWYSFIKNITVQKKYGLTSKSQYHNSSLIIPIFTESGISGSNISKFSSNLAKIIGNGSSFPIILEPESFMDNHISRGANPMPIYEEALPETNDSNYYSYLGNTMNFTHSYDNGFYIYLYNITDKNQSVTMRDLNANISILIHNYNVTNLKNVEGLLDNLYMYIFPLPGTFELKVYSQSYIMMHMSVTSSGIILFNNIDT
jgi:ABC-type transport system substrate-binding protein